MKRTSLLIALLGLMYIARAETQRPIDDSAVGAVDPVTESRLGKLWFQEEIKGYKLSTNKERVRAVNEIGHRILDSINDRPDLDDWQFTLVDTPTVNAFSFAGGKILVCDGLVELMTIDGKIDEGMLASVLGHEITHAKFRHMLNGIRNRNALNWALANVNRVGGDAGANSGLTGPEREKFFALARARFTREQEFEADMNGAYYAAVAGYGFDGGIRWAQRIIDKLGDRQPMEYLEVRGEGASSHALDHPTWAERSAKMQEYRERVLNIAGEFNWGCEMLRARNFEKATQCFRDVTQLFPNCFQAWNSLGIAYQMRFLIGKQPDELRFQTDLVDYLTDLRARVRGADDLPLAIKCFREAYRLNPAAPGVRGNLATALALQATFEASEGKGALSEAEQLFGAILAADAANPQALNGKAITLCLREPNSSGAEEYFSKAAALKYLPAEYNLARLRLDLGRKKEGVAGLTEYLDKDSSSAWAGAARHLLTLQNAPAPPAPTVRLPRVESVLHVRFQSCAAAVVQTLQEPERREKMETSGDSAGEILWYDSLGLCVVLSEDAVQGFTIFQPWMPHAHALPDDSRTGTPPPEIVGVSIGATVEELEKKLGQPTQVSSPPGTAEKLYSYDDEGIRIDFRINFGKVYAITLSKKT